MIERQDIGTRMSKIVKHNGTVYLWVKRLDIVE